MGKAPSKNFTAAEKHFFKKEEKLRKALKAANERADNIQLDCARQLKKLQQEKIEALEYAENVAAAFYCAAREKGFDAEEFIKMGEKEIGAAERFRKQSMQWDPITRALHLANVLGKAYRSAENERC